MIRLFTIFKTILERGRSCEERKVNRFQLTKILHYYTPTSTIIIIVVVTMVILLTYS